MNNEIRLQQIKDELSDDNILARKFDSMTKKLMKDEESFTLQEAQQIALALLAHAATGSIKLDEDEMKFAVNQLTDRIAKYNAGGLNE